MAVFFECGSVGEGPSLVVTLEVLGDTVGDMVGGMVDGMVGGDRVGTAVAETGMAVIGNAVIGYAVMGGAVTGMAVTGMAVMGAAVITALLLLPVAVVSASPYRNAPVFLYSITSVPSTKKANSNNRLGRRTPSLLLVVVVVVGGSSCWLCWVGLFFTMIVLFCWFVCWFVCLFVCLFVLSNDCEEGQRRSFIGLAEEDRQSSRAKEGIYYVVEVGPFTNSTVHTVCRVVRTVHCCFVYCTYRTSAFR